MRQLWIGLVLIFAGMGWLHPVFAQESVPLELNKSIMGTLGEGESITYTFDIPFNQDVVVNYEADHLILSGYSVTTTMPETKTVQTKVAAGGGGDGPGTTRFVIPAYSLQDEITQSQSQYMSRNVELTLYRAYEVLSSYRLLVTTQKPQVLSGTMQLTITPEASKDLQILAIRQGFADPFTVSYEPLNGDGSYLWVANVPSIWQPYTVSSEGLLIFPKFMDVARWREDADPNQGLTLYYAGENNFRLLVYANEPYTINYFEHTYQPLIESQSQQVEVMAEIPVRFLEFDASNANSVTLTARLIEGGGAFISLYETDRTGRPTSIALGDAVTANDTVYPDFGSVTVPIEVGGQMSVVVRIPSAFDQSRVRVELEWTTN